MTSIKEIVEDVVLIALHNHEPLATVGITQNSIFAKVSGYDDFGVWIEAPRFKIPDLKKKPTKKGESPVQTVAGRVLIPWGFIVSLVHFPGVEGFDYPDPLDQQIGFEVE